MIAQNVDIELHLCNTVNIALASRRIPWNLPVLADANCGAPSNVLTKGRYRAINAIVLCDVAKVRHYNGKWWGTLEDWKSIGGSVKHGERPTLVANHSASGAIACGVYNVEQISGVDQYMLSDSSVACNFNDVSSLVLYHKPEIRFEGTRHAYYYSPYPFCEFPDHISGDYIVMMPQHKCVNESTYYSTLLHELVHWTEPRTKWIHCMAVREFVAEMGSRILGMQLGVPPADNNINHYLWLDKWLQIFKDKDPLFYAWAAVQAERACDYLLKNVKITTNHDFMEHVTPRVNYDSGIDGASFEPLELLTRYDEKTRNC